MENIVYEFGNSLYINLTNRCPCSCTFCIRSQKEGLGTEDSLWLERDPTPAEVKEALSRYDLQAYREIIFCGYGEPFCALDVMLEVCKFLRTAGAPSIRINTNGLGDLINGRKTASSLEGLVDTISVSLNAGSAQRYQELTRSTYGERAYSAMLLFAQDCKTVVPKVKFSVVDVISPEEIQLCKKTAGDLGIPLRVRHFSD